MSFEKFNNKLFDKLSLFSLTSGALVLLAIWAFFEASIWFVIPDFFLLVLCVLSPKKYKKFFLIGIIFSLIGISAYFMFVSQYPGKAGEILIETPFIRGRMIEAIGSLYNDQGISSVLKQTTTVIPVKVWTYQAVTHNFNFFIYLLFVGISRAIRIFLICFIFSIIGNKFKKNIKKYSSIFLFLYIILFFLVLFYIT